MFTNKFMIYQAVG